MSDTYPRLYEQLVDTKMERDHFENMITRLRNDIKPLLEGLRVDCKKVDEWSTDPKEMLAITQRCKLFGILDMFNLQARALPNAQQLKIGDYISRCLDAGVDPGEIAKKIELKYGTNGERIILTRVVTDAVAVEAAQFPADGSDDKVDPYSTPNWADKKIQGGLVGDPEDAQTNKRVSYLENELAGLRNELLKLRAAAEVLQETNNGTKKRLLAVDHYLQQKIDAIVDTQKRVCALEENFARLEKLTLGLGDQLKKLSNEIITKLRELHTWLVPTKMSGAKKD